MHKSSFVPLVALPPWTADPFVVVDNVNTLPIGFPVPAVAWAEWCSSSMMLSASFSLFASVMMVLVHGFWNLCINFVTAGLCVIFSHATDAPFTDF